MAVLHANRPRTAILAVAVVVGLALASLLHRAVLAATHGPLGELQHLAAAPLLALLALAAVVRWAPGAGERRPTVRTMVAVVLLAAAAHEALEVAHELLALRAEGVAEHLAHAAPPALALLLTALVAATGLTWLLVLAAARRRTPGTIPGFVPLVPRSRGTATTGTPAQAPRTGRSAGRAPPRVLPA